MDRLKRSVAPSSRVLWGQNLDVGPYLGGAPDLALVPDDGPDFDQGVVADGGLFRHHGFADHHFPPDFHGVPQHAFGYLALSFPRGSRRLMTEFIFLRPGLDAGRSFR